MYSKFPDYVQSTWDSGPWFPKEWGNIFRDDTYANPRILSLAAERLEALKRPRRQTVGTAQMTPWRELGNWIEFSPYNTPFIYGMWKQDPELEFILMQRDREGFIESCKRLEDMGLPFFIARHGYEHWEQDGVFDYGIYWDCVEEAIDEQIDMIGKPPIFVFNLENYREGSYNEILLSLFEIPVTVDNLNMASRWSKTYDNATKTPGVF